MDQFCDFEWVSLGSGVRQIGCDFPKGKVKFTGDYTKHQCGLEIRDLNAKDRGIWMCEVEKYYTGFSRRYAKVIIESFSYNSRRIFQFDCKLDWNFT